MIVFVNHTSIDVAQKANVARVLEQAQITTTKGIAVAVNNAVVPKAEWQTKTLNENDKITIIRATQGG